MPEFFDYDPHKGVRTTYDYDNSNGNALFYQDQDLEGYFAMTAEARNTDRMRKGMMDGGRELHMYASIPEVVQIELRNKGIDIYSKDPTMIRRMFKEINTNYPMCKVTNRSHV